MEGASRLEIILLSTLFLATLTPTGVWSRGDEKPHRMSTLTKEPAHLSPPSGACSCSSGQRCCSVAEDPVCCSEGQKCCDSLNSTYAKVSECCDSQESVLYSEYSTRNTHSARFVRSDSGTLQLHALPVGQGDCTLIVCPNGNAVVYDCGSLTSQSTPMIYTFASVAKFIASNAKKVVAVIITHPDADHYNYLYHIDLNNETLKSVIYGGHYADYSSKEGISDWIAGLGLYPQGKFQNVSNGRGCIGNCSVPSSLDFCEDSSIVFEVLAANVGRGNNNQMSIVTKLTYGTTTILLPGDIEDPAAKVIVESPLVGKLRSKVYKIAHHGAGDCAESESCSNSMEWLRAVSPEQSFVSQGYNFSQLRHPRCDTIYRLLELKTVEPAPSHALYCGLIPGGSPLVQLSSFCHKIYATFPSANMSCLIEIQVPKEGPYTMTPDCTHH